MNPCLAIVAHQNCKQIAEFWPLWAWLEVPIVAFMPDGETWPGPPVHRVYNYGISAHKGPLAFQRMVHCWRTLGQSEFDSACIIEPDAIPLIRELPAINAGRLSGWLCKCEEGMFPYALLPPWTASRAVLQRLGDRCVAVSRQSHPDCIDLTDRWICKAASSAGIYSEMLNNVMGYVRFPGAIDAIKRCKPIWIHGFKTREELEDLWPLPS